VLGLNCQFCSKTRHFVIIKTAIFAKTRHFVTIIAFVRRWYSYLPIEGVTAEKQIKANPRKDLNKNLKQ
jgi:hypothetical protein